MRNVIFAINITLDGCCDHTKQFVDAVVIAITDSDLPRDSKRSSHFFFKTCRSRRLSSPSASVVFAAVAAARAASRRSSLPNALVASIALGRRNGRRSCDPHRSSKHSRNWECGRAGRRSVRVGL